MVSQWTEFLGERLTTAEVAKIKELPKATKAPKLTLKHGQEPRLEYRQRSLRLRTCLHLGQTKLAVGLLRFLMEYGHLAKTVVYVGAAPGTNIVEVARLFPEHVFYLYDPAKFRMSVEDSLLSRIFLFNVYFTDDIAVGWAKRNIDVLFVSDIRTSDEGQDEFESEIVSNMVSQAKWYRILGERARMSMLKLRFPYESGGKKFEYPSGDVWLQPWAAVTSTETRLVLKPGAPDVLYDPVAYEQEMYYHNTIRREWEFHPRVFSFADSCWDCCATATLYTQYVRDFPQYYLPSEYQDKSDDLLSGSGDLADHAELFVRRLMKVVNQQWNSPPHGKLPDVPMVKKRIELFKFLSDSDKKRAKKRRRKKYRNSRRTGRFT